MYLASFLYGHIKIDLLSIFVTIFDIKNSSGTDRRRH